MTKEVACYAHHYLVATLKSVKKENDPLLRKKFHMDVVPHDADYIVPAAGHDVYVVWQINDDAIFFEGPGAPTQALPLSADWLATVMKAAKCPDLARRLTNYAQVLKKETDVLTVLRDERPDLLNLIPWIAAAVCAIDQGPTRRGENLIPQVKSCRLPVIYEVDPEKYGGKDKLPPEWTVSQDL